MFDLWLDSNGVTLQVLWNGGAPDLSPEIRSAKYAPGAGDGETVVDLLDWVVVGTQDVIEGVALSLSSAFELAADAARLPGLSAPVYLNYRREAGGPVWRSPISGGWVGIGTGGLSYRGEGGQLLNARIERANYWEEAALRANPVTNPIGHSGSGTLLVLNHRDFTAGHVNYCTDDLADPLLEGVSSVSPFVLTLESNDPANIYPLTVFTGHRCHFGAAGTATYCAGEDGLQRGATVGTVVANAACQAGAYLKLDWNGAAETELWHWQLSNAQGLLGLPYRVVMRLADYVPAVESIWYFWRIYALDGAAETLVWESEGQLMETLSEGILGPAVDLPPWPVVEETSCPVLRLVLVARAGSAGAHALLLDFVMLMGLEGWRVYRPLGGMKTLKLIDDGYSGAVRNDAGLRTHSVEGPGIDRRWRTLDSSYSFVVLRHEGTLKRWPIEFGLKVKFQYRTRRRQL